MKKNTPIIPYKKQKEILYRKIASLLKDGFSWSQITSLGHSRGTISRVSKMLKGRSRARRRSKKESLTR